MNGHAMVDWFTAVVGARAVGRNRFFARSHVGAPIAEVTRGITMDGPALARASEDAAFP
jgi:hypothetical protein